MFLRFPVPPLLLCLRHALLHEAALEGQGPEQLAVYCDRLVHRGNDDSLRH